MLACEQVIEQGERTELHPQQLHFTRHGLKVSEQTEGGAVLLTPDPALTWVTTGHPQHAGHVRLAAGL